jgi:hypothetical protein
MTNELHLNDLDAVNGGMRSRINDPGYHGPTLQAPTTVGGGDTIDGIPWGGKPGDGSWGTVNGNLPGAGNWGN